MMQPPIVPTLRVRWREEKEGHGRACGSKAKAGVTVSCRPPMRQRAEGWSNEDTRLRVCGGSGGDKKGD
jgi:hypothetical protein